MISSIRVSLSLRWSAMAWFYVWLWFISKDGSSAEGLLSDDLHFEAAPEIRFRRRRLPCIGNMALLSHIIVSHKFTFATFRSGFDRRMPPRNQTRGRISL